MAVESGEEVFFHGHPSWRAILGFYLKWIVATVLAGAVAGLITAVAAGHVQVGWIAAVVAAGLLLVLVAGFLKRVQTTYTITNQRLTINSGLLAKDLHETRLERVQNVNCSQSMLDRLLRVGTVDFDTAAGAEYNFAFQGVARPLEIVRTVDQALRDLKLHGDPQV